MQAERPLCKKPDNDDNPTKCDVCESGYYPKDETTCEPIDDIDICNSSDGKSNVCELCKAGFYLKTDPQNNKKSCADQHVGGCKILSKTPTSVPAARLMTKSSSTISAKLTCPSIVGTTTLIKMSAKV